MQSRDIYGRFMRSTWWNNFDDIKKCGVTRVFFGCFAVAIILGITIDILRERGLEPVTYKVAEAYDHPQEPEYILIEARINWTPERIEQEIRDTFPEDPDLAVAIAKAESGSHLKATAYNPEWHDGCQGSYGVFQMACVHGSDPTKFYDPGYNIKRARELYDSLDKNGNPLHWKPWGGYSSGGYLKYL